jgi:PAS domain S-box-containing protein
MGGTHEQTPQPRPGITRLSSRKLILISHLLIAIVIAADVVVNYASADFSDVLLRLGLTGMFVVVGLARYVDIAGLSRRPSIYLILYHLLLGAALALVLPAYSPYIVLWSLLLFQTEYRYKMRGLALSLSVLGVALLNQAFREIGVNGSAYDYIKIVVFPVVFVAIISIFFIESKLHDEEDQEQLESSYDRAEIERQRLISLINSMADGVVATDQHGVVSLYNAAALNIIDTNEDLTGTSIDSVLHLIDDSAKNVELSELLNTDVATSRTDLHLVYSEGEKINLFLNISPIKLTFQQNSESGFILSFRDITREKSLEEERNEFISVVSHELRTPIAITEANISNAMFIAEKGDNVSAIKSSLDSAHRQAVFLATMINDLSTLSRAERGKLDMNSEQIDPREVMDSLLQDYKKEAETKHLELRIEIDETTPPSITSNRLYIREILQNFVTNSLKYTKEGSVSVTSRGVEGGVEFSVADTGIGISKSDQKRVFDKFFRSEDFRTRESSGTGLGLYVTMKLCKLINGTVTLESKLNEGSTFRILVPDLKDKTLGTVDVRVQ